MPSGWSPAASSSSPFSTPLEVDHINHSKTDCRLENLRLITHRENTATRKNCLGKDVVQNIRAAYIPGETTLRQLAALHGVSPSTIHRILTTTPRTYHDSE